MVIGTRCGIYKPYAALAQPCQKLSRIRRSWRSSSGSKPMDALPEDWQAVPNEKEKCEEITRLTVWRRALISIPVTRFYVRSSVPAPYSQPHRVLIANVAHASCVLFPTTAGT